MNSLYGNFRQIRFSECWETVEDFKLAMAETNIPMNITESNLNTLFYLLYSYYGNSVIASSDLNRFTFNVATLIFQFGPTWEKRLEIQAKLRNLTDAEIERGAVQIYNHAFNPSSAPTTQTTEEINYINEQTVTKNKKGKLDGLAYLWDLLDTDVTGNFLNKFKKLFLTIVQPELPLWYVTED